MDRISSVWFSTETNLTDRPLTLTVQEACQHLHLSREKLYQLIRANQLESFKLGRARRIRYSALESFIDQCVRVARPWVTSREGGTMLQGSSLLSHF